MKALEFLYDLRIKTKLDEEIISEHIVYDLDEAIAELEDLIKPKTCESCEYDYCGCSVQYSILRADNEATFETFCCNSYNKKA